MRPATLLLQTEGECDIDPERLFDVFSEQRQRFVTILRGFGPEDWVARTRCTDWSAHDVVRHLCDANVLITRSSADDSTLDVTAGFDPRVTPGEWLRASAGESPGASLERFVATTEDLLALARSRLAERRRFDVPLPYGQMDWTVVVLHAFWDSWVHERDVLLARGDEHPTNDDATFYATSYGLFIAAAVALMFGDPVEEQLKLDDGVFNLASRGDVTLMVTRVTTAGHPAARVADVLAGRRQIDGALDAVPTQSRGALLRMADFMNAPVDESRT